MHRRAAIAIIFVLAAGAYALAQRGQRGQEPPQPPRAIAPVDLTGYWVSVVTEDWRWRMVTPAKGDYDSVPLNAEGRRVADTWDAKRDNAAGESCRAYAAPAVMRIPGRIHITWADDSTLKIETEAGNQTRLLRFGSLPTRTLTGPNSDFAQASLRPQSDSSQTRVGVESDRPWQGESVAAWELGAGGGMFGVGRAKPSGALKVVTTRIRPGYLRKNGVPFSANTVLTEYFNALPREENGDTWLVVTTVVSDPQYLTGRFITSTHFKKLSDGAAWRPTSCR